VSVRTGDEYFALQYAAFDQGKLLFATSPLADKLVGTKCFLQRRRVASYSVDEFLQTLPVLRCDIDAIQDTPP